MGFYDFVVGIGIGIALACLINVIKISRESAVRAEYTGAIAHSTVRRHVVQRRFLHDVGSQIHVMKLAGYLFFGSIVDVEKRIQAIINEHAFQREPFRYLILDFKHVSGIDFSAAEGFEKIHRILSNRNVEMVLSGVSMSGKVGRALAMVGLFNHEDEEDTPAVKLFEDLNQALEACENGSLVAFAQRSQQLARESGVKPTSIGTSPALLFERTILTINSRPKDGADAAYNRSPI